MIQDYTFHCHSDFSDGDDTLENMIKTAKELGFSKIGISDHLIVHKNIEQSPSWNIMTSRTKPHIYRKDFQSCLPAFNEHCEQIRKLAQKENFKISVGFEVDFFTYDGWLEELKDFLAQLDYDYLINGNHFLFAPNCETIYCIDKRLSGVIDKPKIKSLISSHFKTITKAAQSGLFKFTAHLDYVRKMGAEFYLPQEYQEEKTAVLEALTSSRTATEISTKGLRRIGDFYPDEWFLKQIKEREIPIIISDDAHRCSELGFDFDQAEAKLSELGITNRLDF